jgi:hypothetical protein
MLALACWKPSITSSGQSPGRSPLSDFRLASGRHSGPSPRRRSTPTTVIVIAFTSWLRSAYLGYSWRLIASIRHRGIDIQLYGEEIVSVVPRAGDKLDLGRVSVMDRIDAALEGRRLYRGKAAAGMAVFDAGFFLDGIETEVGSKLPNFEYLSTEGPTREYLQRHVGVGGARFVWPKTVSREVIAPWEKPNPLDDVEFTRGKREIMPKPPHTICWRVIRIDGKDRYHFLPHEVCYLAKQRPDRQFNSDDKFGDVTELKPKPQLMPKYRTPHYRNGRVIAFEYLRRSALRTETKHEIEILRRTDAVQTSPGISRRRGQHRAQAHDEPQRILQAGIARKVGT